MKNETIIKKKSNLFCILSHNTYSNIQSNSNTYKIYLINYFP